MREKGLVGRIKHINKCKIGDILTKRFSSCRSFIEPFNHIPFWINAHIDYINGGIDQGKNTDMLNTMLESIEENTPKRTVLLTPPTPKTPIFSPCFGVND